MKVGAEEENSGFDPGGIDGGVGGVGGREVDPSEGEGMNEPESRFMCPR